MHSIYDFVKLEVKRRKEAERIKKELNSNAKHKLMVYAANRTQLAEQSQCASILKNIDKTDSLNDSESTNIFKEVKTIDTTAKNTFEFDLETTTIKETNYLPTNIPFKKEFLDTLTGTVNQSDRNIERSEKMKIFMEVNRRMNQISTSLKHAEELCKCLEEYKTHPSFEPSLIKSVFDQGKLQVERHFESYSSYSYVLCKFYSPDLFSRFKQRLFFLNVDDLRGIYAIYFGVIKMKRTYGELKRFLNAMEGGGKSGVVVESMLKVLGGFLRSEKKELFLEMKEIVNSVILPKVNDIPVAERIKMMIEE